MVADLLDRRVIDREFGIVVNEDPVFVRVVDVRVIDCRGAARWYVDTDVAAVRIDAQMVAPAKLLVCEGAGVVALTMLHWGEGAGAGERERRA